MKKMERLHSHRRASIVQLLGHRALTGRRPTMEAHLHADYVFVLWNKSHATGCFTDCVVRQTVDIETYRQVTDCMRRFDMGAYCSFGNLCTKQPSHTDDGVDWKGHSVCAEKDSNYLLIPHRERDLSGITCHCPHVASYKYGRGNSLLCAA
jgi:hypothetical protein